MIDLNKINLQFDINNLDVKKITTALAENQKIIAIVIMLGSLILAGMMFNDYRIKDQSIHFRLSQEQGKLDTIKARDAAIGNLSQFKSFLSKTLSVFDLITLISNDAKSSNSKVVSYVPSLKKDMGLYDAINVRFEMTSDNFKDMMLFIRKVEKSNSPIIINEWTGHAGDGGGTIFSIVISVVLIHP